GGRRFDGGGTISIAVTVIGGRNNRVLAIGRIRRERARAGIGRALIDIVVLGRRLGEALIGAIAVPIAAAAGVAAGIDRRDRLARIEAAGHGGRSPSNYHGSRRDQSRNQLTHYSLLLISVSLDLTFLNRVACLN